MISLNNTFVFAALLVHEPYIKEVRKIFRLMCGTFVNIIASLSTYAQLDHIFRIMPYTLINPDSKSILNSSTLNVKYISANHTLYTSSPYDIIYDIPRVGARQIYAIPIGMSRAIEQVKYILWINFSSIQCPERSCDRVARCLDKRVDC